ncbi:cysteine-rich secretory protein LCCL domain-containing 2 [Conger conger]|uniref:cysteine-rich secretory protein LCCL domain-containing 2 n=1 Tax=Conger conger TaxID=82655 RepID=UPI002A59D6D2|nr:cysteine-rich secretory protein LCCL domain-containing 2 [Conger conger]
MEMGAAVAWLLALALLVPAARPGAASLLPDSPELRRLLSRYQDQDQNQNHTGRARRAILWADQQEILQLHNKLRGLVQPPASNMERMVWDEDLEASAASWSQECRWEHGPEDLLMSIGQNLAVHWGRYRSPAYHVQAWYDEAKDYTYPYPEECTPWCPDHCKGPMCTHYTQLVWATTTRVGCAVHVCPKMDVWGEIWENSVYLVCNYSPKGNWIGEAPYKHGRPCSQCPPSYGGGCRDNLCFNESPLAPRSPETADMNEVEVPPEPVQPPPTTTKPSPPTKPRPRTKKPSGPKVSSAKPADPAFLVQDITCETRMRDVCRGAACNRYRCPANCLYQKGRVWGTVFYDVQSSICRAAIHQGVADSSGGLVDVTREDGKPFFIKTTKNGIESFSKYKPGNAFIVARVEERSVDCFATVAEICPFKKPGVNCPRVLCPDNCKNQPSHWSPVVGNVVYSDSSSVCRAALHAGVLGAAGGPVDLLALDKKSSYVGTLKNGVQSESKSNPEGCSFRVFAVRE